MGSAKLDSVMAHTTTILDDLYIATQSCKNMGKYTRGSGALIIIGIVGLIVAVIVGIMVWRAIVR
jgi:hypothetical protein